MPSEASMTDTTDETARSAEKAYAAAAAEVTPVKAPEDKVVAAEVVPVKTPAATPAPVTANPVVAKKKTAAPKKRTIVTRKTEKPAAPKPDTKTAFAKAAKRAARVAKAAAAPAPVKTIEPKLTVIELKEKIMATAKTADFTKPMADALGEIQTRAKVAYEKGTEAVAEATEFTKGNVEAIVESSKIFAAGAQTLGK